MPVYVVEVPGDDAAALERTRVVRDGFSWPAFCFAPLWQLYHRLWLVLVVWLVAEAAFFAFAFPHLPLVATIAVDLVARLYIGFEGPRFRLAKGARRAALVDVVTARDREEAEAVAIGRLMRPAPPADASEVSA